MPIHVVRLSPVGEGHQPGQPAVGCVHRPHEAKAAMILNASYSPFNISCPNLSLLVLRYFSLYGLGQMGKGTFSTIFSP